MGNVQTLCYRPQTEETRQKVIVLAALLFGENGTASKVLERAVNDLLALYSEQIDEMSARLEESRAELERQRQAALATVEE